jgi:hypothetical protein
MPTVVPRIQNPSALLTRLPDSAGFGRALRNITPALTAALTKRIEDEKAEERARRARTIIETLEQAQSGVQSDFLAEQAKNNALALDASMEEGTLSRLVKAPFRALSPENLALSALGEDPSIEGNISTEEGALAALGEVFPNDPTRFNQFAEIVKSGQRKARLGAVADTISAT